MKKLLAFLLVATMIVAMFAIPAAAEDTVNYEEEFKFVKKAPKVDGKVEKGEYGTLPVHTYPEDKEQFVDSEHNDYAESDWDFEFYGAWDADYLYMAWVLNTETHVGIPEIDHETDANADGIFNEEDYGYMWMYSCVQFIFTPGAPEKGTTAYQAGQYDGDYLEVGLALTAENNPIRIAWCKPTAASALDPNEWDASIVRDEDAKTTTYEVRIPWGKSGLSEVGNEAQFGFTYAVAAQEYNTKKGMIEWQNGVLSAKDADSAAVITLTGAPDIEKSQISQEQAKVDGTLPSDAADALQIALDGVNTSISGEKAYLYTDPSTVGSNNNTWATSILLKPVDGEEGYYEVVESATGSGATFSFTSEIEDGMIAISVHSDGEGVGKDRSEAAKSLAVGDKVGLFGVDLEKGDTIYKNAMIYKPATEQGGETSGEVSGDVSDATSDATSEDATSEDATSEDATSEDATSEDATSEDASAATSTDASDAGSDDEGGLGIWLWVIIAVVIVAVVAVVVVLVIKKK